MAVGAFCAASRRVSTIGEFQDHWGQNGHEWTRERVFDFREHLGATPYSTQYTPTTVSLVNETNRGFGTVYSNGVMRY